MKYNLLVVWSELLLCTCWLMDESSEVWETLSKFEKILGEEYPIARDAARYSNHANTNCKARHVNPEAKSTYTILCNWPDFYLMYYEIIYVDFTIHAYLTEYRVCWFFFKICVPYFAIHVCDAIIDLVAWEFLCGRSGIINPGLANSTICYPSVRREQHKQRSS